MNESPAAEGDPDMADARGVGILEEDEVTRLDIRRLHIDADPGLITRNAGEGHACGLLEDPEDEAGAVPSSR